jgi:hypothetical protein
MVPALRAGVGRAVITPPVGIAHAAWGVKTHQRAEGIDRDLLAAILALATGRWRPRSTHLRPIRKRQALVEASLALLSDLRA